MKEVFHSVKLIEENCRGCTRCMTKCPVEAIRLRNSKAVIYGAKCIDCGGCIRVCPYGAHSADKDSLSSIEGYKIKVAIPSVTVYPQFGMYVNPDLINNAIKSLGFDEVYDITYACDIVSEITRREIEKTPKPAISPFCPTIVKLIENSYPSLVDHIVKVLTPIEVAASLIREKYFKDGYGYEDIGIFYFTPCVSWITKVKNPSLNKKIQINGTIPISDVFPTLLKYINKNKTNTKSDGISMSYTGLSWAVSGAQVSTMNISEFLAVDGTENVIKVFDDIEKEKLNNVNYIEAMACTSGCLGGVLLVENPFNAKRIITNYENYFNFDYRFDGLSDGYGNEFIAKHHIGKIYNQKLADDFESAVQKMKYMNRLINTLPGKDCGLCGSPSCSAFAEDVVRGFAKIQECRFINEGGNLDNEG